MDPGLRWDDVDPVHIFGVGRRFLVRNGRNGRLPMFLQTYGIRQAGFGGGMQENLIDAHLPRIDPKIIRPLSKSHGEQIMKYLIKPISLIAIATLLQFFSQSVRAESTINIQILNAIVKDQVVAGATVTLQKNGEQSVSASTNAQGQANFPVKFVDDQSTILIVKKSGYSNLVVKCPCAGTTYAISPVMTSLDGMRIVLNWGASPSDLDSHLVYPNNHVYFVAQKGQLANLDVDDTTSYGPETITIEKKKEGERYIYAVHNYSDRENLNSYTLSKSAAKVFVYVGQTLIRTYYVPSNKVGNMWAVFAVTAAGEFQDYNVLKNVVSEDRLELAEFEGVIEKTTVPVSTYSVASQADAQTSNRLGEAAYHAGKYDEAIRLYQAAIESDGNYGQAYSNLGLVFQKAGRVSEALWANRKAIALANGASAAVVRASSHYNNGKIYETASQWQDALREFRAAKSENANPVYDQAILRMQQKGAH